MLNRLTAEKGRGVWFLGKNGISYHKVEGEDGEVKHDISFGREKVVLL